MEYGGAMHSRCILLMTTKICPVMHGLPDPCQCMSNFMKDNWLGPTQTGPIRHNTNQGPSILVILDLKATPRVPWAS